MTINELRIQLDLQPENRINTLKDVAMHFRKGYLFVDSSDGHCYLFDEDGNEDDVKKIKNIRTNVFCFYKNLKLIEIPNSVESIGHGVFSNCKNLELIVIPDSVKQIGNNAFSWSKSLKSIVIPNSVESIGDSAFYRCESLESIEIPNSVESIGDWAFWNCKSLKSVSFKGKTIDQIKAMENYPFGIKDESIIRCV